MVLNKIYLLDLIRKANAEKRRYNRALKKYKAGNNKWIQTKDGLTNEWDMFIRNYAVPMHNILNKVDEFREYFEVFKMKIPKLPEIDLCIKMAVYHFPSYSQWKNCYTKMRKSHLSMKSCTTLTIFLKNTTEKKFKRIIIFIQN